MKIIRNKLLYLSALALFSVSCTNLEIEEMDSLVTSNEEGFTGVNPGPTLESAYADLRAFGNQSNMYALQEVTSDEMLVPTRGTDWGDNGVWRTLHQHTWDVTHVQVLGTWNVLNANVFKTNQILHSLSNPSEEQTAEARFLRAFNMFYILDFWGKVPFREADEGVEIDPRVLSAQEAFDFIVADLDAALPRLPQTGPGEETIRASQAAAHFLRAKVYLNRHILTGTGSADAADMNRVIESVNAIRDAGFELEEGYFEIFAPGTNNEIIFYTDAAVGNRIWNSLHYHQVVPDNAGGGWNGFSTTAEFYALFEGPADTNEPGQGQEERRGFVPTDGSHHGIGYGFLVGQQYTAEGEPMTDRAGRPLVYTKEFPGLIGNRENHGIRMIKYHPEHGAFYPGLILFRYADAHLMKAEAILRGGSGGDATDLVNELREIRDASPLSSVSLDDILDERGRELYAEGLRRTDQIRFGTYTDSWDMKPASDETRRLFPIPVTAIATNPNLEQNPGY